MIYVSGGRAIEKWGLVFSLQTKPHFSMDVIILR